MRSSVLAGHRADLRLRWLFPNRCQALRKDSQIHLSAVNGKVPWMKFLESSSDGYCMGKSACTSMMLSAGLRSLCPLQRPRRAVPDTFVGNFLQALLNTMI